MNSSLNHRRSNPDISAAELQQRLHKGEDLTIIDVREPIEYYTYNIGGLNIPLSEIPNKLNDIQADTTAEMIIVCQAGLRSKTAQSILQQNGYTRVRNLTGGLLALRKLER